MNWLGRLAADETFWTTAAQVQAAIVIALVLEGRKETAAQMDEDEFVSDIKERCELLLTDLGDKYRNAMVLLMTHQMLVTASESAAEAVAVTRRGVKDHLGLADNSDDLIPLRQLRDEVRERTNRARRSAESRLIAYGGRAAIPGLVVALVMLLPGGTPLGVVTVAALVVLTASLLVSLLVLAGRWDALVAWLQRRPR